MKKHYNTKWLSPLYRGLMLSMVFVFASTLAMAQLSGTYTINSASSTSGTNFKTFADLRSSLATNGISGAVTVNVVASSGPYLENVSFTAVSGASATNTITINGNGETIRNTSSSIGYVIQMNGADYFTFNGLKIDAASTVTGTRCMHLYNGADNNTVKDCELIMSANTSTGNSTAYVAFTSSTTGNSAAAHGSNNTFDGNKMWNGGNDGKGPYYGVVDYRSSSFASTVGNNMYKNNEISDVYYYWFYMYYTNGVQVMNNKMHTNRSGASTSYGFYGYYNYTTSVANKFDNNDMYNMKPSGNAFAAYYYYSSGTASLKTTMNGNKFHDNSGNNVYGLRMYYYCNNSEVNDNKVYNNAANGYFYYGAQQYYNTDCEISRNEIYGNTAGYYVFYAIHSFRCANVTMDGNVIRNNSAGYYMYYGIYFYYNTNASCTNNTYYNNFAGYGHLYAMYTGYCDNVIIAHNTFVIDKDVDYYNFVWYHYYYNTPTNVQMKNNILYLNSNTGFGYQYPVYCYYNSDKIDWANNVVYDISGGTKYYNANASNYSTFADFAAASNDKTSVEENPKFVDLSGGNIKPTNPKISNMGTPGLVAKDIVNVTRTACGPDPGAYEFTVDHSASNFTFAGTNECGGYREDVTFDFTNGVTVGMTDVKVFYTINGGSPVIETIDTVGGSATVTYTFKQTAEFHEPGDNVITVGLLCDDNTANNTISKTIKITPAPHSFTLAQGASFPGYYRVGASGGTMTNPDVTVPGKNIEYAIVNPANYPGSTYGTDWTLTPKLYTQGGSTVSSGFTYTAPTSTTAGNIAFDPASSLADSMVFVGLTPYDVNTGCDSLFGRWVYIPHTPEVAWTSSTGCDGDVISFTNGTKQAKGLVEYLWDFDDPSTMEDNTSTISDPVHKFSTYGSYDVTVSAWNYDYPKFVYTLTKTVSISPVPTVCYKVTNACEGDFVKFTNCTTAPVSGTIDYTWNFGDGTATSKNKDVQHKYIKAGGYQVTLTASLNGCATSLTKNANQFARPKADFSTAGKCNLEDIMFTNGTTISLGNSGYRWDFGDGSISNLPNPSHPFATPGKHTVKLKAISEFGCEHEVSKEITLNESPKADFNYTDACNLKAVEFTRGGTLPSGSSIFQWDFDGEAVSTKENPSHLFSTVGVKKVSLMVSSDNGCADMITKEFVVKLQAQADFVAKSVCEGEDVVFTNKSSVASGNLNYTWRFGDGGNSNLTSPRHAYMLQSSGVTESFNVTLVAIVPGGCSDSVARTVTVNAKSNPMFAASTSGRSLVISNQATTDATNIYNWRFGEGGRSSSVTPSYTYTNVDKGEFEVCLTIINNAGCESEHCEMVTVDLVGINDVATGNFTVYPNPNRGMFNVKVSTPGAVEIVIMDAMGKTVREIQANDASGVYGVDLTDMAAGVYLVQVTNGGTTAIERVTISK